LYTISQERFPHLDFLQCKYFTNPTTIYNEPKPPTCHRYKTHYF